LGDIKRDLLRRWEEETAHKPPVISEVKVFHTAFRDPKFINAVLASLKRTKTRKELWEVNALFKQLSQWSPAVAKLMKEMNSRESAYERARESYVKDLDHRSEKIIDMCVFGDDVDAIRKMISMFEDGRVL